VELQELESPAAAEGEVVLEVLAAGICGSELEGVRTPGPVRVPPLVMGHELVGRRLDTGETVAVNPLISCGACDMCDRDAGNLCRHRALVGIHRPGGFAEQVAVPRGCCRPLPADVDVMRAALAEPLANAVHALRLAERHLGDVPGSVGVIGAGMLGMASAFVAAKRGIGEITITDLNEDRLALAAATLGARASHLLEDEYDVVIDAVGSPSTRAVAVDRLRPQGVSVWIGLQDRDPGFDALALVRQERLVTGTFAYRGADFEAAIELCADADPRWIESIPLTAAADRFVELMRAPGVVPKTVIVP
jgi:threonine dehydrogenase-like Zn-dependent dehydrogenase